MHFVYILQSLSTGRFYIGESAHIVERFYQHQAGGTRSTRFARPWWMPYYEIYQTKQDALRRERELKNKRSSKILRMIILKEFPGLELL